jgi:hypothetical protein
MVADPSLVLSLDGMDSSLDLLHARHGTGLDAFDIGGVEAIDGLLILPLLAQGCGFLPDVHGRHDGILLCWVDRAIVVDLYVTDQPLMCIEGVITETVVAILPGLLLQF